MNPKKEDVEVFIDVKIMKNTGHERMKTVAKRTDSTVRRRN